MAPRGPVGKLADEVDKDAAVVAIRLRPGSNGDVAAFAAVAGVARAQGGQRRQTLCQLDTVTVRVPQAAAETFSAQMRRRADVPKVGMVPRRSLSLIPNDPQYPVTARYLGAVTAPAAWDVHESDPNVLVAVVDSGVDVAHPDLAGRLAGTYNAVDGCLDVTDTLGHGTFVVGWPQPPLRTVLALPAPPWASVLAVKVADAQGDIWTDYEVAGILWATDNGAKVINLSLGGDTSSQIERDTIAYAISKGILVVAAAGNESTTTPMYPAAYPQVIAVGATDAAGRRASFPYLVDQQDAAGLNRVQAVDSNWKVCSQKPAPRTTVSVDTMVILAAVKLSEQCP